MTVHDKLLKIQSSISVPKNQHNKFGNYDYRSCEDILSALKPFLTETKCTLTVNDDLILIGNRYYIKSTATLIDCESGESISNESFAREEESKKGMDSSQITGTASSYARKYALNGLLLLDDVKDADTNENHQQNSNDAKKESQPDSKKNKDPITENMIIKMRRKFEENSMDEVKVCYFYNISDISKMSIDQHKHLNQYFDSVKERCKA